VMERRAEPYEASDDFATAFGSSACRVPSVIEPNSI
jgi:hypothetical protein